MEQLVTLLGLQADYPYPLEFYIDIAGAIAFAFSGAGVGIRKHMDIFGVTALAIVTATGGGMLRDMTIGVHPPVIFHQVIFPLVATLTANIYFWAVYFHKGVPQKHLHLFERLHFWADTLGVASYAVSGAYMGIQQGLGEKLYLLLYMGFMTACGGGILRDVLSGQLSKVFTKRVYALAAIIGAWIVGIGKGKLFFLIIGALPLL